MDPKAPKEKKHFKRLRRILTKIVRPFGRESSNVPAPALATPSGGSQPHSRPNTPAENIHPAANSSHEDVVEHPVAIAGKPAEPATLHTSEEPEIAPATASQEPRDADAYAFECPDNVPSFNEAVKRFKSNDEVRYKAIFEGESSILGIENADSSSDPTSHEGSQKPMGRLESSFQGFKVYLPSLGSVQALAMALSRLDPHGIAPLVVSGVFFVITLAFNTLDPTLREKISTLLSKTITIMNKWMLYEIAQAKRIPAHESKYTKELTKSLPGLHLMAFETISFIQGFFDSKVPSVLQRQTSNIENSLSQLERYDRECTIQKDKVDGDLKSQEDNSKVLNWIRGEKNPEPSHSSVVCQTGLHNFDSKAALWFLNTPQFKSWQTKIALDRAESVLWLEGIVGSGKTTLMCRLISYFEQYPIKETRVAYYYCYGSTTDNQRRGPRYEEVIRGLCHRLAWNDDSTIAEPAKILHGVYHSGHNWGPHVEVWEGLLRDLIIQSRNRILFIIDALDECSTRSDQQNLLKFIQDMQQHGLYLIISSRRHAGVERFFQNSITRYPVVTTEATKDMEAFLDMEIARIKVHPSHARSLFLHDDNLKRLRDALMNQTNGMFRWVQLWLGVFFNPNHKSVLPENTARKMLEMLESGEVLPAASPDDDLAQVYQKLWDINGDGDKDRQLHQTRVFRFAFAAEGLHRDMLLEAIQFDPKAPEEYAKEITLAYLQTLYHNFLRERDGFLEFEHVSAKTFILKMQDSDSEEKLFADELRNHHTVAETSLLLLKTPGHELWKKADFHLDYREGHHRFLRKARKRDWSNSVWKRYYNTHLIVYVMDSWVQHCRKLLEKKMDIKLRWLLLEILRDLPLLFEIGDHKPDRWNDISCISKGSARTTVLNPLILALILGLCPFHCLGGVVEVSPNLGDIMTRNTDGETSLHVAVRLNDRDSVKDLLKINSRAHPNVPLLFSVDDGARNLLHVAQDYAMVEFLLDFEAERATTANPSPYKLRCSKLLQGMDRENNTPTNNLLERCDEDSMIGIMERFELTYYGVRGALGRPIWHVAVRRGFKRIVRLLLDRGASIDDIDCPDGTALGVAAAIGDGDMALFLLGQGADVNRPGGYHGTPLGAAVYNGQDKVVALFLGLDDLNLERAIRLSPYDHDEMWNRVGDESREVAEILQHYGRRYATGYKR